MKRQLDKLEPKHLAGIRQWLNDLEENSQNLCPFLDEDSCWPCDWIFPGFAKACDEGKISSMSCPCDFYSLSYVKRVARKILRKKGARQDNNPQRKETKR